MPVRQLREFLGDVLGAAGAGCIMFSLVLVVLIAVGSISIANPYSGVYVIFFVPAVMVVGAGVFLLGAALGRGRGAPPDDNSEVTEANEDTQE